MDKSYIFAVSDVHGSDEQLEALLEYWNPEEEQLVILGDLCDRGPNAQAVFRRAKQLKEEYGAICLRGNHEDMLMKFLDDPVNNVAHYYRNGGEITLESFLGDAVSSSTPQELAAALKDQYPWLIDYLDSLELTYEWGKYFFVHAGMDLTLDDWRESTVRDKIWIRQGFLDVPNETEKTFVFGHTPTMKLRTDGQPDLWVSEDNKIGIDGGAVYGGQLNGVKLSQAGIETTYQA